MNFSQDYGIQRVEMGDTIRISKDASGRITVTFSYDPAHVTKVKGIEGYRWQPKEKYWSFPY